MKWIRHKNTFFNLLNIKKIVIEVEDDAKLLVSINSDSAAYICRDAFFEEIEEAADAIRDKVHKFLCNDSTVLDLENFESVIYTEKQNAEIKCNDV